MSVTRGSLVRLMLADAKVVIPKTSAGLLACLCCLLSTAIISEQGGWWAFSAFLFFGVLTAFAYSCGVMMGFSLGEIKVLREVVAQEQRNDRA